MSLEDILYEEWKVTEYSEIIYKIREYCKQEAPVLLTNKNAFSDLLNAFNIDIKINNPTKLIDDIESISDIEEDI